MKFFQKKYQLIGIMLLFCGGTFFANNERDKKLQSISKAYGEVFAKADLFAEQPDMAKLEIWEKMVKTLKDYAIENADGNTKLLDASELCHKVSFKLLQTLINVYNDIFAQKELSWQALTNAKKLIGALDEDKTNLTKESNKLKNTRFYIGAQKKNNAKAVLLRLMSVLEIILKQLKGNFKVKLQEEGFLKRSDTAYEKWKDSIPAAESGWTY